MIDEGVRALPAPALRPFVAWYSGYRQAGIAPASHRGLPSPFLTVVVTLDEPLVVDRHPDPRQPPGAYDSLVGGLHTTPVYLSHQGWQSGVQLAVEPLGARALFGLPAGELGNLDVSGDLVLGSVVGEIRDRLRSAPDWPTRFAILDAVLLRIASDPPDVPELARAWRMLVNGGASVAETAAEVGWSPRRLSGRFGAELGVSPKAAARLARFDRARRRLQAGPILLAELAVECGYYDQAHLAREFREMAGAAPSRWLAAEGRFVQAELVGEWAG